MSIPRFERSFDSGLDQPSRGCLFETAANAMWITTLGPAADSTTRTYLHPPTHAGSFHLPLLFQDFCTQSSAYDGLPYKGLTECFDLHEWNDHRKTGEDRRV